MVIPQPTSIEEPKTSPRSPHRAPPQHHPLWRAFRGLSASLVFTTWALEGRSYKKKGDFPSKFPTIRFNPSRFRIIEITNKLLSWDGRKIEPKSLVRFTEFAVRLFSTLGGVQKNVVLLHKIEGKITYYLHQGKVAHTLVSVTFQDLIF